MAPFKDCVLESGQRTEEGEDAYFEYAKTVTEEQAGKGLKVDEYNEETAQRKEIFFNSVLTYDEIDRLTDEKVLVNWRRYTKKGEQKLTEIKRDGQGTIRENLIIKDNNYLALHSFKKQLAGKIKLIYIDLPSSNNTFVYNNNF